MELQRSLPSPTSPLSAQVDSKVSVVAEQFIRLLHACESGQPAAAHALGITVEPMEPVNGRLDECRFFPMVGPARLMHCHYKCTIYYDKTIRSYWPVPFSHVDQSEEVVYIDKDHLIRCAGPTVQ